MTETSTGHTILDVGPGRPPSRPELIDPVDFAKRLPKRVTVPPEVRDSILRERGISAEIQLGSTLDFLPVAFFSAGMQKSRSVARIIVRTAVPGGQPTLLGYGTGFLVAPLLLMTNNHVLPSPDVCRKSAAQFMYEVDYAGVESTTDDWELDPDQCFVTSAENELDFTIVSLRSRNATKAGDMYGMLSLRASPAKIAVGEAVNIIQHPKGQPKEAVLQNNRVCGFYTGGYIRYEADTLTGSSGAPVFNNQWELVGLHHSGVLKRDSAGNYVMKGAEYLWEANEGIRISAIVDDLKQRPQSSSMSAIKPYLYE